MNNINPIISVIVPAYNAEKYLRRCINSILAQTFTDFELLLIDDGSTDKSGEICDEYADKYARIRVFHKANGGVSSARNVGLDNAVGEYICFCDADDWVDFHWLQGFTEAFPNDLIVQVIISAIWYRRSGRMVPPVSRCRIFHSGDVVPHQISFFDILVHQRV